MEPEREFLLLVDKLFEKTNILCKDLTVETTLEQTKENEGKLMILTELWMAHNRRTVKLFNETISKSEQNKKILNCM